ncbi:MAG: N-acetylneuraminate synthase family protein [Candidatus Lokiarchaeota archaeon]
MKNFNDIIEKKGIFIIAECGVNYYDIAEKLDISLMEAAKLMIEKAAESGADAVKFQSYKADKLASKNSPAYWDLSEESTKTQYDLFKKFDKFGEEEYKELSSYCNSKKVIFLSTPFDFEAVDYLNNLMPIFKISSSDITNLPLIKYIASKNKPIFLSTGASDIGEIYEAVNIIKLINDKQISLMHCILSYPTDYKDANLNMIKHLNKIFPDCLIGYSDHTKTDNCLLVLISAYLKGAKIIEKHFTLDKELKGNDHYHAMDPIDLKRFISNLNLIKEIDGQFLKEPLECEKAARLNARRSIIAKVNITKNDKIKREMITFKRPGIGIPPNMLDYVIGGLALKDIKENDIIMFDDIRLNDFQKQRGYYEQ